MKWNSTLYDKSQSFVSEYGKALISFIPQDPELHILDVGCGTGDLTQKLSEISTHVISIDGSKEMIQAAKVKYPHLTFDVMNACHLKWKEQFDVVFSNAVFHWIADQKQLLGSLYTALRDGGRLVCEFGAHGNIKQIETAYISVTKAYKRKYRSPFYFPTVEEYSALLRQTGFRIEHIYDFDGTNWVADYRRLRVVAHK